MPGRTFSELVEVQLQRQAEVWEPSAPGVVIGSSILLGIIVGLRMAYC